jgi:hypothetical protein
LFLFSPSFPGRSASRPQLSERNKGLVAWDLSTMDASKDHPTPYPGNVRQRFPRRSSPPRSKENKASNEISIIPKREKRSLSVSKSVSTLDLSGKDKPARATRRLSIPSKYATPVSKTDNKLLYCTPSSTITENKSTSKPDFVVGPFAKGKATAKSASFQGSFSKNQGKANGANKDAMPTSMVGATPQEIPKSAQRRKFSTLRSASYWLAQIKLAESAGKHGISLGFFRLALESTAEPLQRVRDELKSYAKKHSLLDLGEVAQEVLLNYGVLEEVTAEVEAKTGAKELVMRIPEACPLIPEHDEEEESHGDIDGEKSPRKAEEICSSTVQDGNAVKAEKFDPNKNTSIDKVESIDAEKPGLTSQINKNSSVQKWKKSSTQPVTKLQASVVRKSSSVKNADKGSPIKSSARRASINPARRYSINPAMTKTEQNEIRDGNRKDKGSTKNKPSQLDLPSSIESMPEEDKENLDSQHMDYTSIQTASEDVTKGKIGASIDSE